MGGPDQLLARILPLVACGVKGKDYKGLWWGCEAKSWHSDDSIVLELAGADDVSGNEKSGSEREVD